MFPPHLFFFSVCVRESTRFKRFTAPQDSSFLFIYGILFPARSTDRLPQDLYRIVFDSTTHLCSRAYGLSDFKVCASNAPFSDDTYVSAMIANDELYSFQYIRALRQVSDKRAVSRDVVWQVRFRAAFLEAAFFMFYAHSDITDTGFLLSRRSGRGSRRNRSRFCRRSS